MKTVLYYRNLNVVGSCNVADTKHFLIPNCVGTIIWKSKNKPILPSTRHDYYLLYVVEGELEVLSGKNPASVKAGQFICFYPETVYEYKTSDEGVGYYFVHFTGHSAAEIVEKCGIKNSRVYDVGMNERVVSEWKKLFLDFTAQDSLFVMRSSAKLLKILSSFSENIDTSVEMQLSRKLRRSIDYIHENFNGDISIPDLAELEHLSCSRYYTLFKENTGYSPSEYIIVLRINRACTLMHQTDMTVKEISSQVGYHDPFYFSRLFKKYMGMSPGEYKKKS